MLDEVLARYEGKGLVVGQMYFLIAASVKPEVPDDLRECEWDDTTEDARESRPEGVAAGRWPPKLFHFASEYEASETGVMMLHSGGLAERWKGLEWYDEV